PSRSSATGPPGRGAILIRPHPPARSLRGNPYGAHRTIGGHRGEVSDLDFEVSNLDFKTARLSTAEAEAFVKWHAGQLSWAEATRDSRIQLHGPSWLVRGFPTWNRRSMFAHIKPDAAAATAKMMH